MVQKKNNHLLLFLIMLQIYCAQLDGLAWNLSYNCSQMSSVLNLSLRLLHSHVYQQYIKVVGQYQKGVCQLKLLHVFSPCDLGFLPVWQLGSKGEQRERSESEREGAPGGSCFIFYDSFRSHRVSLLSYLIRSSSHKSTPSFRKGFTFSWKSDKILGSSLTLTVNVLTAAAAKSLQSCLTLCDPIDCSPPGFPIPGILQARTLEWVAVSFSNA